MVQKTLLSSYSYSSIAAFNSCPRAFKYKYIEELTEAFSTIEAHMGTSVHATLEWAYKMRQEGIEPGLPEAMEQYKQIFWNPGEIANVKVIKNGLTPADYFDQGKTLISSFFNRLFPWDRSTTLYLEHKFEMNLSDDIKYKGVIDRLARDENGLLRIIDYKTGKAAHPLENFQLPSYALYIFENNIEHEIQLYIENLREQRTMSAVFPREGAQQIRSALLQQIKQIQETGEYPTRPSILCLWCGFNHTCENPYESVKNPGGFVSSKSTGGGGTGAKREITNEDAEGKCPQCGSNLTMRNGKYGAFMGCSRFPQCRFTKPI